MGAAVERVVGCGAVTALRWRASIVTVATAAGGGALAALVDTLQSGQPPDWARLKWAMLGGALAALNGLLIRNPWKGGENAN